jgi:shikimate kinase
VTAASDPAPGPARSAVLVLIGPMGAGKTKVGKRVAAALGLPFADTDRLIVAEHGPIAAIFDERGEPAFRELEREAVARAVAAGGVVALGGGAVLDASTRALLAPERVALITVDAEAVEPRIRGGKRPLVRGGIDDWIRIAETRRPIYESLADAVFDTSRTPHDRVAADVAEWVRSTP